MLNRKKDIVCPYCLMPLDAVSKLRFECPLCHKEASMTTLEQIRLRFFSRLPRCRAPECRGQRATICCCGYCGHNLPPQFTKYGAYLRFALVGPMGSGKSTYLTALLHQIRKDGPCMLGAEHMNEETRNQYATRHQILFEHRQLLEASPPGVTPVPQHWRVFPIPNSPKNVCSLTIYDGAGEDCTHLDEVISRYINGAKELILLIDPLSIGSVKERVDPETYNGSVTARVTADDNRDMVADLAYFIRRNSDIAPDTPIKKRTAVVFTKLDTILPLMPRTNAVTLSPSHSVVDGFNETESVMIDHEVRDWLTAIGESSFLSAVERHFSGDKIRFFAVSSLGGHSNQEGRLENIRPFRVADPLFWMLAEEGIIQKRIK